MNTILSAGGLNTYYGRSHILFDMGLEVRQGETVCLVGRNGAGKTTTFRSLMNLSPPKSGRVEFLGRNCSGLPPYRMARLGLGFVPEDRRILGPFTVRENLEMGVIAERKGRWNLKTVLECFPTLARMLERMGGSLSGGEQQMLTIGRALMGNPEVLILDEPTEGLSPVIVGELKELVLRLKREGTTILLSEQNIRFALAVSDRVAVMDKGRSVYTGTVEAFRSDEAVQSRYLAV
ncbi:High-affinity branched-chain amino acid transport ATP-binding protein LivF [Fundidesulfovibrio magnetotacticus]|uniref:High-affinity branched-chain amino acid transport ATP-binding protein LivF n=1 Tax=Fundidesulfovibrio magnetotacticus TaxID=2730080 RepID=A0A6V8LNZ4_9BACT|nr:ABC transporter ATP-binding protein [Fundidesulfovibrio magnetotacticus]GFK93434.1 High-affinity branched-chain amino acid transport ATP-binding protein LivF [Fundidesulfovibrio magnetotacticus]